MARKLMRSFLQILGSITPGFGAFLAITLFFCFVQSAHDGLIKRNRDFDSQRWWYPIYKILKPT
jgi:hypothetical protein